MAASMRTVGVALAMVAAGCVGGGMPGDGTDPGHDSGIAPRPDGGTEPAPDGGAGPRDGGRVMPPDGGVGSDAGADAGAPVALEASGDWDLEGTWDVRSPIGGDRTLGDVAADLFVEQAVTLAPGIPEDFEDEAADALHDMVGAEIQSRIDAGAPAELQEGSALMETLGMLAARVHYESELTLVIEDGSLTGTETFRRIYVMHEGRAYELPIEMVLLAGTDTVVLQADWAGSAEGSRLDVDPHVIQIRFGALVLWLASAVLRVDVAMLQSEAIEAIACDAIVDAITDGRGSIEIDVFVHTFTISRETLMDACGSLIEEVEGRALGMFAMDTPMEVGGEVLLDAPEGAAEAETMTSGPEHGGHLLLIGPRAVNPPVRATFTGVRRPG